jgi:pilus assembly protein FimV
VAVKPPPPEPSLLDDLLENPVVPAAAGGLLALLAGFAFYRARQRQKSSQVDSSFLESRMQPDSFFGSSGGQRIDTADEAPTGSSLAYSPSQLDAAGDVDPVAEAEVYLAYGRDLQAEEILKEALRMNPSRIAIHGKLLEIFAKRRDVRAFEVLAADAFKLCAGEGAEWERICEFGRELDHNNPLYQPGGRPKNKAETSNTKEPVAPVFASSTIPVEPHPDFAPSSSMPVDLDLGDLDLSFDKPASAPLAPAPDVQDEQVEGIISGPVPLDVELSWDALAAPAPVVPSTPAEAANPAPTQQSALPTASQSATEPGMIEFDLGSLSLDLDRSMPADETPAPLPNLHQSDTDPLETKLALAQEFQSIGDSDGARTLVEEVVARASGPLKAKAQRFLAELG